MFLRYPLGKNGEWTYNCKHSATSHRLEDCRNLEGKKFT